MSHAALRYLNNAVRETEQCTVSAEALARAAIQITDNILCDGRLLIIGTGTGEAAARDLCRALLTAEMPLPAVCLNTLAPEGSNPLSLIGILGKTGDILLFFSGSLQDNPDIQTAKDLGIHVVLIGGADTEADIRLPDNMPKSYIFCMTADALHAAINEQLGLA